MMKEGLGGRSLILCREGVDTQVAHARVGAPAMVSISAPPPPGDRCGSGRLSSPSTVSVK